MIASAVALVGAGCNKGDRRTCSTVGRDGGVLQSYDTVLTIAIQPEALDETQHLCLSPTEAPPSIFGEAYLLDPPVRLNYDAVVSYRGALPDDLSDVNVGRISARDFASGDGAWVSLKGCRVDEGERHVQCLDTELSKFYGLLDRVLGDTSDTIADTSGDTGDATTDSTVSMTTSMTDPTTDTDPQPIDYPPECDSLARGPYDIVGQGTLFEPEADNDGPEDMAADGQGGFIARSGTRLFRLDVTGGTLGTPNDPGFFVSELLDSPLFGSATLGIRYAPSGNLILAQGDDDVIRSMSPDGMLTTIVEGIDLPNGVFVDNDGFAWYTEFLANGVWRVDLAGGAPTMIAMSPQPNGIHYDPLRQMVFYPNFMSGELWGVAIGDDGTAAQPVLVTTVEGGTVDGLAMDVCGNLYAVDNAGPVRLLRVFMDDFGMMTEAVEEIAVGLGQQANATFGVGAAYGAFETAIFLTGLPGEIEYVDVHITGAAVPGLSAPPPTVDDPPDTTGTDSGGSGSSSTGAATTSGGT